MRVATRAPSDKGTVASLLDMSPEVGVEPGMAELLPEPFGGVAGRCFCP